MNKILITLLCSIVALLAWRTYNLNEISQIKPYRNLPKERNLEIENLVLELESSLENHEEISAEKQAIISDIRLTLASYYLIMDQPDKAQQHSEKIMIVNDKLKILTPYLAIMLYTAEKGQHGKVSEIISKRNLIEEKAKSTSYIDMGRGLENLNKNEVPQNLCAVAIKTLREAGEYDLIEGIIDRPPCNAAIQKNLDYQLADMIAEKDYFQAYKYAVDTVDIKLDTKYGVDTDKTLPKIKYSPVGGTIPLCLADMDVGHEDIKALLDESSDISDDQHKGNYLEKYFLAIFLAQSGQYKEAKYQAQSLPYHQLKMDVLYQIYEKLYLDGQREEVLELADEIDLSLDSKKFYGKYGFGRPDFERVWTEQPTTLAYELALKIEDPDNRAMALYNIYKHTKEQEAFPNCEDFPAACLAKELQKIIEGSTSTDKYKLYSITAQIYRDAGDYKNSEIMYKMRKNYKSHSCFGDGCHTNWKFIKPHKIDSSACQDVRPSQLEVFPLSVKKTRMFHLVRCHEQYKVHEELLSDWAAQTDALNAEQNYYLYYLGYRLAYYYNIDEAIRVLNIMSDPVLRAQTARSIVRRFKPEFPVSENIIIENKKKFEARRVLIEYLLDHPEFKDDNLLWVNIIGDLERPYWKFYDERYSLPFHVEKEWASLTWDLVDVILDIKPALELKKCSPASFSMHYKECKIRRLIARKKYQDAINHSRNKEEIMHAMSLVLVDKLQTHNDLFKKIAVHAGTLAYAKNWNTCNVSK